MLFFKKHKKALLITAKTSDTTLEMPEIPEEEQVAVLDALTRFLPFAKEQVPLLLEQLKEEAARFYQTKESRDPAASEAFLKSKSEELEKKKIDMLIAYLNQAGQDGEALYQISPKYYHQSAYHGSLIDFDKFCHFIFCWFFQKSHTHHIESSSLVCEFDSYFFYWYKKEWKSIIAQAINASWKPVYLLYSGGVLSSSNRYYYDEEYDLYFELTPVFRDDYICDTNAPLLPVSREIVKEKELSEDNREFVDHHPGCDHPKEYFKEYSIEVFSRL